MNWDQKCSEPPSLVNFNRIISVQGNGKVDNDLLVEVPNLHEHLASVYSPLIKKLIGFENRTLGCPVEVFQRRFGIDSSIFEPLNNLTDLGCNFVLAGGKVRDWINNVPLTKSYNDYDLWFLDEESWDIANDYFQKQLLRADMKGSLATKPHVVEYFMRQDTLGGTHYDWKFQLVRSKYSCIEEIITDFDFACCGVAYDGERIYWSKYALRDIKEKRIRYQTLKEGRNSFVRVEKYLKKGYFIRHGDWAIASIEMLSAINNSFFSHNLFTNRDNSIVQPSADMGYYPMSSDPDDRWQLRSEKIPAPTIDDIVRIANDGLLDVEF